MALVKALLVPDCLLAGEEECPALANVRVPRGGSVSKIHYGDVAAIVGRVTFNAHILETGTQSYRLATGKNTARRQRTS